MDGRTAQVVLLRDAPEGDLVVETRLDVAPPAGDQQGGLVLYGDDDRYLELAHTELGLSRVPGTLLDVTESLEEGARPTTTPPRTVVDGPSSGALPADRTWLRLEHRWDAEAGEHDVRMASSTDGSTWSWGSTWSLPARKDRHARGFARPRPRHAWSQRATAPWPGTSPRRGATRARGAGGRGGARPSSRVLARRGGRRRGISPGARLPMEPR